MANYTCELYQGGCVEKGAVQNEPSIKLMKGVKKGNEMRRVKKSIFKKTRTEFSSRSTILLRAQGRTATGILGGRGKKEKQGKWERRPTGEKNGTPIQWDKPKRTHSPSQTKGKQERTQFASVRPSLRKVGGCWGKGEE